MKEKQHPYCYPSTNIYRNKEDIRDARELEDFERLHSALRMAMLPRNMEINSAGFREIHRYFFQNVYDWARKDRTVDTGRPGAPFCKSAYIEAQLNKRFAAINAEGNLHGLDADQFAARAAEHINELNAIHPFLDGNGRVQRAFLEILAEQAGHEFDLGHIDPKAWNEASIQGFQKEDHSLMAEVIGGCILRD